MAWGARARPWSTPAMTATLLLLAVIFMAKPTAGAGATAAAAAAKPSFASCRPASCNDVFTGCTAVGCPVYTAESQFARKCCKALHDKRKDKRCGKCALLLGFTGYFDLTGSCTNEVQYAAKACREKCTKFPNDPDCSYG
ncbi:hypothetical protein ACP4OV_018882 [Aristida adscensionis]